MVKKIWQVFTSNFLALIELMLPIQYGMARPNDLDETELSAYWSKIGFEFQK